MKKQIRSGVFETNSSSTHSCTIMMKDDYDRWERDGLYLFDGYARHYPEECRPKVGKMYTKEEVIEFLKANRNYKGYDDNDYEDDDVFEDDRRDEDFKKYTDESELEEDYQTFTTPGGETVVALCQYGYDY